MLLSLNMFFISKKDKFIMKFLKVLVALTITGVFTCILYSAFSPSLSVATCSKFPFLRNFRAKRNKSSIISRLMREKHITQEEALKVYDTNMKKVYDEYADFLKTLIELGDTTPIMSFDDYEKQTLCCSNTLNNI